ncbi:MAG: family oxidoreductase [Rhodospirillales bacterium]|nr:family oxidoreductase [Rhodospirillales bacterium]
MTAGGPPAADETANQALDAGSSDRPHPDHGRAPGHVLVVGATGLIGSAVIARLRVERFHITAVARSTGPAARRLHADHMVRIDLRDATRPEDWEPHLAGIDAVVNCAGVLQDGGRDSTVSVHAAAPAALYEACARRNVQRIVHFSAMNVEKGALSAFSWTKHEIEQVLQASSLDWVILRPSVVLGRAAYGGSALFRGLASLPVLPRLPDAGRISVVQLDDVTETVAWLLRSNTVSRCAIDLAGPVAMSFEAVVASYRRWLGWRPARLIGLPPLAMNLAYRLGDLAGLLGWRPPIRTTARREMARGAVADPAAWTRLTGIVPHSLEEALARDPAPVQDRWFAALFLLRPLALAVFALFWMVTGLVSLGPGYEMGLSLMRNGGAGALGASIVIAGALADLAIGTALLWRRTVKPALFGALALTVIYAVAATAILPGLWAQPLGPLVKIAPILMLNLMLLAILEER